MARVFQLEELPWEPVRPSLAHGVFGRTLLDGDTKAVYTRVEPGGGFPAHRDGYGHLMLVVSGTGRASVAGSEHPFSAGTVLTIEAGEEHSYRNTGDEPLVLVSLNLAR